eukprot:4282080-Lingulodinium_polyedra.AAC.1
MEMTKLFIKKAPRRRACPEGTPPAELFDMMMRPNRGLDSLPTGVGGAPEKLRPEKFYDILKVGLTLIRKTQMTPA